MWYVVCCRWCGVVWCGVVWCGGGVCGVVVVMCTCSKPRSTLNSTLTAIPMTQKPVCPCVSSICGSDLCVCLSLSPLSCLLTVSPSFLVFFLVLCLCVCLVSLYLSISLSLYIYIYIYLCKIYISSLALRRSTISLSLSLYSDNRKNGVRFPLFDQIESLTTSEQCREDRSKPHHMLRR
jgi:hypothetical protein